MAKPSIAPHCRFSDSRLLSASQFVDETMFAATKAGKNLIRASMWHCRTPISCVPSKMNHVPHWMKVLSGYIAQMVILWLMPLTVSSANGSVGRIAPSASQVRLESLSCQVWTDGAFH